MDYFRSMSSIYTLLKHVVDDTQVISIPRPNIERLNGYQRLESSNFVISDDIIRTNRSTVTAHILNEYRPNQLKLEKLMRDSEELYIDVLLRDLGGVRGVPLQSY